MATAVAPRIVGLEDNETTLDLPDSLRNTADAKRSFPALNYAFAAGHAIALESDGAGALSIRVTNPGGLVHSQQLTKGPASVFLQQNDFNLGFSLCDLSNKYKQAIYGVEDDELEGWMPTEHSPYFAFETKYGKASKRLMSSKASLTLATAGCAKVSGFDQQNGLMRNLLVGPRGGGAGPPAAEPEAARQGAVSYTHLTLPTKA